VKKVTRLEEYFKIVDRGTLEKHVLRWNDRTEYVNANTPEFWSIAIDMKEEVDLEISFLRRDSGGEWKPCSEEENSMLVRHTGLR
jgi:hypothetical protein